MLNRGTMKFKKLTKENIDMVIGMIGASSHNCTVTEDKGNYQVYTLGIRAHFLYSTKRRNT